jgi:hypothetical protein
VNREHSGRQSYRSATVIRKGTPSAAAGLSPLNEHRHDDGDVALVTQGPILLFSYFTSYLMSGLDVAVHPVYGTPASRDDASRAEAALRRV